MSKNKQERDRNELVYISENNWDMCLRMAREQDKDELIKNLLMQIAKMRKRRGRSAPLWSFVSGATSHGSGVSCGICAVYGVDSDTGMAVTQVAQPITRSEFRDPISGLPISGVERSLAARLDMGR